MAVVSVRISNEPVAELPVVTEGNVADRVQRGGMGKAIEFAIGSLAAQSHNRSELGLSVVGLRSVAVTTLTALYFPFLEMCPFVPGENASTPCHTGNKECQVPWMRSV